MNTQYTQIFDPPESLTTKQYRSTANLSAKNDNWGECLTGQPISGHLNPSALKSEALD